MSTSHQRGEKARYTKQPKGSASDNSYEVALTTNKQHLLFMPALPLKENCQQVKSTISCLNLKKGRRQLLDKNRWGKKTCFSTLIKWCTLFFLNERNSDNEFFVHFKRSLKERSLVMT